MRPPHWALRLYAAHMDRQMRRALADPRTAQANLLRRILSIYESTEVGRSFGLNAAWRPEEYRDRVPVTDESTYAPMIAKILEHNPPGIVASGPLRYMAHTSGTTRPGRYIPFVQPLVEAYRHFETMIGMRQMHETGRYGLLDAHLLITAGSPVVEQKANGLWVGYGTGIMTMLAPKFARHLVRPTRPVLEMSDWHKKIEATVGEAYPLDIRVMTGVPIFVVPILERLLSYAREQGKPAACAKDIWPNLEVYVWSGSSLRIYEQRLRELFGPDVPFRELYTATETPLALQWNLGQPGMVPDLDYCYFEFQAADAPLDAPRLRIDEVVVGVHYRILVTTLGGLFAYRLGDVVEFIGRDPLLMQVVGRESEFMNLGSEKMTLEAIRLCLDEACTALGATYHNFFVCPTYLGDGERSSYDFHIEFDHRPTDLVAFAERLDQALSNEHFIYASLRHGLVGPVLVTPLATGAIERYIMANKHFGQGKFLHLYNDRRVADLIAAQT